MEGLPADSIGLQRGDRIVSIDGEAIRFWAEMTDVIQRSEDHTVTVRWQPSDTVVVAAPAPREDAATHEHAASEEYVASSEGRVSGEDDAPRERATGMIREATVRLVERDGAYLLGVYRPNRPILEREFGVVRQSYSLFESVVQGVGETWTSTRVIAVSLGRVFAGQENFRENVGGAHHDCAGDAAGCQGWSPVLLEHRGHAFDHVGHHQYPTHPGA